MSIGKHILQRLGLKRSNKPEAPDAYDMRLKRIGQRERRLCAQRVLFKPRPAPLAA